MIILGAIFLNIGHPGLIFDSSSKTSTSAADQSVDIVKDEQYISGEESRETSSAV